VLRWDSRQPIHGEFHVVLSVRIAQVGSTWIHYEYQSQPFEPALPDQIQLLGGEASGALTANAVIQGLTVYRRPLHDSFSGGIDVGTKMPTFEALAEGIGQDPTEVTGSWDVVLAVPTDQVEGALRGEGQAWTHPHAANNLVDGFFYGIDAANPGAWTVENLDPPNFSLAALDDDQAIFGGGVAVSGGYIHQEIVVDPDTSWVLRAIAHSDGVSVPTLLVYDDTTLLLQLDGSASSNRVQPDVFIATFDVATGPLSVNLANGAAGAVNWHQVELLPNMMANPSFEAGSVGGSGYAPAGWTTCASCTVSHETTNVHSGASAVHIQSDHLTSFKMVQQGQEQAEMVQGGHYCAGGFLWHNGGMQAGQDNQVPRINVGNGSLFLQSRALVRANKFEVHSLADTSRWVHVAGVGRRWQDGTQILDNHNDNVRWGGLGYGDPADLMVDDAYQIALTPVAIAPLPADLSASSTDNLLRVDGADSASQLSTQLTAAAGHVEARVILGRPTGTPVGCPDPHVIVQVHFDDNNQLTLLREGSGFSLDYTVSGAMQHNPLPIPTPEPGEQLEVVLEYAAQGSVRAVVNGSSGAYLDFPEPFTAPPSWISFGADADGRRRCDLQLALPGALLRPSPP